MITFHVGYRFSNINFLVNIQYQSDRIINECFPLSYLYCSQLDDIHYKQLHILNTLRPRQDGRHFADDSFTCIFFNENCCILIKFSLKYVCQGAIDNNRALVQIMAWRRSGDKPLSEPMMISLPTHISVTRPLLQWCLSIAGPVSVASNLQLSPDTPGLKLLFVCMPFPCWSGRTQYLIGLRQRF